MLIQNAVILDENFQLARKDILVEGDRIVATGTGFSTEGQEVVDASGLTAVPGFVDIDSSLMLFCKEVKKDFTVCLSGECADEIFAGYPWYHKKRFFLKMFFLGQEILTSGKEYLKMAF